MRNTPLALSALALSVLAACTGNATATDGGALYVRSCSLGCSDGSSGVQVTCQIQTQVQNAEISVLFSSPVDINTVTSSTFRVSNVDSGTTPAGEYFLDPNDPRRVIFRPALSFDANGTPTFGFEADTPYQITIPGELHSANGPYIRSTLGRPNQARLECTILTNDQVTDPVPGPPVVEVYADTVDTSVTPSTIDRVANILGVFDGVGTDGLADNLASGSTQLLNVYRQGKIYILFKDIMNPATLANPLNQTSPFVTVRYDEDGNLTTTADRSGPVAGTWNVSVNTELLQTVLTFQPSASLLSAGSGGFADPRLTVVDVPTSCVDLLLNPALPENGGGLTAMVTELGVTQAITLPLTGGGFGDTTLRDERRTSGDWGTNSRLAPGLGGGSGRLGELVVFPGETVVLNTDSQTFPLGGSLDVLGNADISGNYPATITVTDGVFEFSYLYVQPGGTLRLEGSNPARILVRGIAEVAAGSVVDLSGAGAAAHDSTVLQPQVTTPTNSTNPAAGGARGGVGADRWDFDATTMALWIPIGGVDIPDGVTVVNNGTDGGGIGNTTLGEGKGGPRLMDFPTVNNLVPRPTPPAVGSFGVGTPMNFDHTGFECEVMQIGTAGSGGAYALDGGPGVATADSPLATEPSGASNSAPTTAGGASSELSLAAPSTTNAGYTRRTLDWNSGGAYPGYLRGGSGGGGAGVHAFKSNSSFSISGCTGDGIQFDAWLDHSGANGGDGGGALHLVGGAKVKLNGHIDLAGGAGGSSIGGASAGAYALPGGGGSGGALRVQGREIEITPVANRIDVSGGQGGIGSWAAAVTGGDGSVGLVRLETGAGAPALAPESVAQYITPYLGDATSPFDNDDLSLNFLSIANGAFGLGTARPDSLTSSTSCWIELPSQYAAVTFDEDGTVPGWDIDVIWFNGSTEVTVPYRATGNATFPAGFEGTFGNHLGPVGDTASPVVIRFQGARTTSSLSDPCNVNVTSASSGFEFGSLTPWVSHPAELNSYGVNAIRFVVIFDNTVDGGDVPGNTLANVRGVTNLSIGALAE